MMQDVQNGALDVGEGGSIVDINGEVIPNYKDCFVIENGARGIAVLLKNVYMIGIMKEKDTNG